MLKNTLSDFSTCVFTTADFSCLQSPFKLQDSDLTAKEGSCVEITCKVIKNVKNNNGYWFWMKNANWSEEKKDFTATIIYSTNTVVRPVSPDFANSVTCTGSSYPSWNAFAVGSWCSILICNLNKTDSGNYSFRYVGNSANTWATEKVNLTVAGKYNGHNAESCFPKIQSNKMSYANIKR